MLFLVPNKEYIGLFIKFNLVALKIYFTLSSKIFANEFVINKYQNSVLLIYDTINLKSERLTIPVNSNVIFDDLNLRVNQLRNAKMVHVLAKLKESFPELQSKIVQTKFSPMGIALPRGT